jgi:hypothetical protein
MGALTIAFDTTIVGALALPWVILVVHLFFFEGENKAGFVIGWVQERKLTAVAGVLLFAAAYTLGCVVSRIAQDFFNDDDLYFQIGSQIVRVGPTEDRIIASVVCESAANYLLPKGAGSPALINKIGTFWCQKAGSCDAASGDLPSPDAPLKLEKRSPNARESGGYGASPANSPSTETEKISIRPQTSDALCEKLLHWRGHSASDRDNEDDLIGTARDIFGMEENDLLLKGEDPTLRLRQLHDQIMVLRGAAFNGVVAFSFCVFAWGARLRRERPRSVWRWLLAISPGVPLFFAVKAAIHHFGERSPTDPPYMEFSLLLIGLAGIVLLWRRRQQKLLEGESQRRTQRWNWPALSLLSLVLTLACLLGWWATEVLYGQQVIYSYDSQGTITTQGSPSNAGGSKGSSKD